MFPGPHPGFGGFSQLLNLFIHGVFFLAMLAIVVGLLFLLVRFLLVGTRAAQIYIAQNTPAAPTASTTTRTAAAPAATAATTTAPRARTPKAPPKN